MSLPRRRKWVLGVHYGELSTAEGSLRWQVRMFPGSGETRTYTMLPCGSGPQDLVGVRRAGSATWRRAFVVEEVVWALWAASPGRRPEARAAAPA